MLSSLFTLDLGKSLAVFGGLVVRKAFALIGAGVFVKATAL